MLRSRAKTYLKAMRHKAFRVKCEAPSQPTPQCSECGRKGWIAPPGYIGNETVGPEPSLSPSDRIARALHPLPLFAAATPGGGLLCASCAYMAEQYPQTEQEKYWPHENTPMDAACFRNMARPIHPKGRHQGDSRSLFGIFSHADKLRRDHSPDGKGRGER